MGKKHHLRRHNAFYTGLFSMNIPLLQKQTSFKRRELYGFYTLFNSLCIMTSQKHEPYCYDVKRGIDYECFRNGMLYIFIQSKEFSQQLFSEITEKFSEYLDWPRFLDGMKIIRAKTLTEKLDLYINVADKDGNGV